MVPKGGWPIFRIVYFSMPNALSLSRSKYQAARQERYTELSWRLELAKGPQNSSEEAAVAA